MVQATKLIVFLTVLLLFVIYYLFILFGYAGSSLLCASFSLVAASGGCSLVSVCCLLIEVASRCRARPLGMWASVVTAHGLSSYGLRALEHTPVVFVVHGLKYFVACGILPDQGSNPCPLHWQEDSFH